MLSPSTDVLRVHISIWRLGIHAPTLSLIPKKFKDQWYQRMIIQMIKKYKIESLHIAILIQGVGIFVHAKKCKTRVFQIEFLNHQGEHGL